VLIAGTGRDASYEDLLLDVLPDAAIIHADCLKGPRLHNQDKIRHVDRCLHGLDPGDTVHLEEDLRDKFVSLQDLKDGFLIESGGFNIIKANLGAFEYPAFGAALRDADRMLADTHQIHLEMHRFRSDTTTRAYSSLCLGELLFASFFSAGFFPVAAEQRCARMLYQHVYSRIKTHTSANIDILIIATSVTDNVFWPGSTSPRQRTCCG
jgi:hypothetical protein